MFAGSQTFSKHGSFIITKFATALVQHSFVSDSAPTFPKFPTS